MCIVMDANVSFVIVNLFYETAICPLTNRLKVTIVKLFDALMT